MTRHPKLFRAIMCAFGLALALPVISTLTSGTASASGYILMTGINGDQQCTPGAGNDC